MLAQPRRPAVPPRLATPRLQQAAARLDRPGARSQGPREVRLPRLMAARFPLRRAGHRARQAELRPATLRLLAAQTPAGIRRTPAAHRWAPPAAPLELRRPAERRKQVPAQEDNLRAASRGFPRSGARATVIPKSGRPT